MDDLKEPSRGKPDRGSPTFLQQSPSAIRHSSESWNLFSFLRIEEVRFQLSLE
jgi:hypothetical protein